MRTVDGKISLWLILSVGSLLVGLFTIAALSAAAEIGVSLVLDSSGSMQSNDPNRTSMAGAKYFVDLTQTGDQIAVVKFTSSATTLVNLTTVQGSSERNTLKTAIDGISFSGSTNIASGLTNGYNELNSSTAAHENRAAVLFTDGEDTIDVNTITAPYINKGWRIYVLGLGVVNNESAISQIATKTGGKYYIITPSNVEEVMAEIRGFIINTNIPWPMFRHDLQHTGRSSYLGPQTGVLKWNNSFGVKLSSPSIATDGTVYVGGADSLYAINPDGTIKWTYAIGGIIQSSPAIDQDETIYIGSTDNKLYAINSNGTLKWTYTTGGAIYSSPCIVSGGTIYICSSDDKLYAISSSGALQWSYATGHTTIYPIGLICSPAIDSNGNIYIHSRDNKLYAINSDGSLKWNYTAGSPDLNSPSIGSDGTIYVASDDNKLYAINPDGTLKWTYNIVAVWGSSPAIASDGTIYVGGSKELYAINPNGTLKWTYTTSGIICSSPAIDSNGTVYIGSQDDNIYAINPNGTLKWSYTRNTTGDWTYSSPSIAPDGTLYIGSENGTLYAFESNTAPVVNNLSISSSSGDIAITYDLTDADNDSCNITVQYQGGSAGSTWTNATVNGTTTGISPGTGKSITWNSATDEGGQSASDYKIKIIPNDGKETGTAGESGTFSVDNSVPTNTAPVVSNVTNSGNSGDITITYDLTDANNDTCSITVKYQGGSVGTTWTTASTTGSKTGLTPGTGKTITWNSAIDESGQSASNYKIKITPNDGTQDGTSGESTTFSVNNISTVVPSVPTLYDPGITNPNGNYPVSWSSVSNATYYTLKESLDPNFSPFEESTIVYIGSNTSTNITGKTNDTYYYRVKASNSYGNSDWSNIVDMTVNITPVIVVPGAFGSWHKNIQLSKDPLPDSSRKDMDFFKLGSIDPYGRVDESGLWTTLTDPTKGGYKDGVTAFKGCYDWRQPIDYAAEHYLKPAIEEALQTSGANKVDIVAHSMGGLVARYYIQQLGGHNYVRKFIMLGTPNNGASMAYYIWGGYDYIPNLSGGGYWNNYVVNSFAHIIIDTCFANSYGTNPDIISKPAMMDFIHDYFQGLGNLIPTYNFLKKSGSLLERSSLNEINRNNLLYSLNQDTTGLAFLENNVDTMIYYSDNYKTLKNIIVTDTGSDDLLWVDGKPTSYESETVSGIAGDGTVLSSSAYTDLFENRVVDTSSVGITHGDLPEECKAGIIYRLTGNVVSAESLVTKMASTGMDNAITFSSTNGTNMLVVDSQSRKTGYDETGVLKTEIPNSDVLGDSGEGQMILISNPGSTNTYTVNISKAETGLAGASITYINSTTTDKETAEFNIESQEPVSLNVSVTDNSDTLTINSIGTDSIPPNAITDFRVSSISETSITLKWDSPGDDGTSGTTVSYDMRYSTSAITESNWSASTQCTGEPSPHASGIEETFTATGLSSSTTYYFAIKSTDNQNNTSLISNSASGTTETATTDGGSGGGGGGGCFIATAAYGTPMAKEVIVLSRFRDEYLLTNNFGRDFVSFYYKYGPTLAKYISTKKNLKIVIKISLKPLVIFCNFINNYINEEEKSLDK